MACRRDADSDADPATPRSKATVLRISKASYANVTATLALVMAMGGTSYAAITITGTNIKNGSVKATDLASGSVTSAKVRNGTLQRKDFQAGQLLPGAPGPEGVQGVQGAQGAQGLTGDAGTPATKLFAVVHATDATLLAQSGVSSFAHTGTGEYTIVFNQAIGSCAWVATPGGRNGGTSSTNNRVVTLSGNAVTDTIQARTGLLGTATDMTFNIAVLC